MSWFKRSEKGIQTKTEEKKDIPKGLMVQNPNRKNRRNTGIGLQFLCIS